MYLELLLYFNTNKTQLKINTNKTFWDCTIYIKMEGSRNIKLQYRLPDDVSLDLIFGFWLLNTDLAGAPLSLASAGDIGAIEVYFTLNVQK